MNDLRDKIVNEKYALRWITEKETNDFDALKDGFLSQQFIRDI